MILEDYSEDIQYNDQYGYPPEDAMRDVKMIELEAWLRAYYKGEIHE